MVAAFTQTIRNGVGVVGGGPASLWNAHLWGAFRWGEGTVDMGQQVRKLVTSSLAPTTATGVRVQLRIAESITLDSAIGFGLRKLISETVAAAGDLSSQRLRDGAGYQYLFPDRTPEGESRSFAAWTAGAGATSTWSTATAASTAWSDA